LYSRNLYTIVVLGRVQFLLSTDPSFLCYESFIKAKHHFVDVRNGINFTLLQSNKVNIKSPSSFVNSVFSSPELKVQVSFSDRPVSVCLSVRLLLLHFQLLQNHWANSNQTWYKSSLRWGDSSLFKWRGYPFSKGR
jgi:hypothetical protein